MRSRSTTDINIGGRLALQQLNGFGKLHQVFLATYWPVGELDQVELAALNY
jgi:hypothetical protein